MRYINDAVIMAAGRGQRMMPLTQDIAKPMAPYLDTTLIGHGIRQVKKHIQNIHITVGYMASTVAHHVLEAGVSSVINTNGQPNAWWIHNTVLSHLKTVFVLTCDNVTDIDFEELEREYTRKGCPHCMVVPVRPIEGLDGDYIHHDIDRRVKLVSRDVKSDMYCSGIQILNVDAIHRALPRSTDFYQIWNNLIGLDQLMVSDVFPKKWTAIDTVSDLERANEEAK